ncbi:DUF732 domain-containing protein [Mycobacterium sp. 1081908.1]|uniref:DUF732 domain-containing protein n=1 Tax=Mycobacterium sp. 1081908.1 TaxID=1834066 RepID=UPI0007FC9FCA|nr:DUF732 domain-containing protein [Mycobacterium sp. 1081908.1]OBK45506.1 hypothetical protein A5655_11760 [Mycobacterium sp. 1081908.1]
MFTGTISHSGALVSAIVVLTGAAILRGGAAVADSTQDDQFLALLEQQGIPALRGVPSLIETAHDVCRTLDAGMSAAGLVDAMVNNAVGIDPGERDYTPGRLARTEARFITAAVGAYCPYDRGKIASLRTNPTGWKEPGRRVTGDIRPAGEIDDPSPPPLPAPPPQAAQIQTPRLPIAAPSAPKHPPPSPQQMEPAGGPQPGGTGGGGGNTGGGNGGGSPGGNGGGIPADPSPGFVRLAP